VISDANRPSMSFRQTKLRKEKNRTLSFNERKALSILTVHLLGVKQIANEKAAI
jgi:hypothetical protein